jgi:hypothetical protein
MLKKENRQAELFVLVEELFLPRIKIPGEKSFVPMGL